MASSLSWQILGSWSTLWNLPLDHDDDDENDETCTAKNEESSSLSPTMIRKSPKESRGFNRSNSVPNLAPSCNHQEEEDDDDEEEPFFLEPLSVSSSSTSSSSSPSSSDEEQDIPRHPHERKQVPPLPPTSLPRRPSAQRREMFFSQSQRTIVEEQPSRMNQESLYPSCAPWIPVYTMEPLSPVVPAHGTAQGQSSVPRRRRILSSSSSCTASSTAIRPLTLRKSSSMGSVREPQHRALSTRKIHASTSCLRRPGRYSGSNSSLRSLEEDATLLLTAVSSCSSLALASDESPGAALPATTGEEETTNTLDDGAEEPQRRRSVSFEETIQVTVLPPPPMEQYAEDDWALWFQQ